MTATQVLEEITLEEANKLVSSGKAKPIRYAFRRDGLILIEENLYLRNEKVYHLIKKESPLYHRILECHQK